MPSSNDIDTLSPERAEVLGRELRILLSDVFALYIKTKNFHWHMRGRHFRDYHLLLDEQGDQLFRMTDEIAERGRKLGAKSIHSVGEIGRLQRIKDNERTGLTSEEMLLALLADNKQLVLSMRIAHEKCDEHRDVATTSLLENWIDETEQRCWFLAECLGE